MALSSILSGIPFLRNLTGGTGTSVADNGPASTGVSFDRLRQQAIEDTVEISPAAGRAFQSLDIEAELSADEVGALLEQTQIALQANDNVNLAADSERIRSF